MSRGAPLSAAAALCLALAIAFQLAACGRETTRAVDGTDEVAVRGNAFGEPARTTYAVSAAAAVAPGQEFALMWESVRNTSSAPLTIRRVEPLQPSTDRVADVVDVTFAPRDAAPSLPFGFYYQFPPVAEVAGSCVEQPLEKGDYVLEPSQRSDHGLVSLVIHGRARAPGVFRLPGQRIFYQQDGRLYYQDIHFMVVVHVRAGARPDIPREQQACM